MKRIIALVLGMLVVGSLVAVAQRTSVSDDFPIYANRGKPDLTIDPKRFVSQMEIVDRFFDSTDCALTEGTVGGSGYRRLLRFDTVVMNMGDGDLFIGDPTDPQNPYAVNFEFAACHQHYHIGGFSNYQLLNLDHTDAALGHKQAFCLEDLLKYSKRQQESRLHVPLPGDHERLGRLVLQVVERSVDRYHRRPRGRLHRPQRGERRAPVR